jgi:hypothetical protein
MADDASLQPDDLAAAANQSLAADSGSNSSDTNVTIILQGSLHYTVFEIVTLAIIMTAMIIVIVIGNMLVVIAISTENNLKSIQVSNRFCESPFRPKSFAENLT